MKRILAAVSVLFLLAAGVAHTQFELGTRTIGYLLAATTTDAYSNFHANGGTVRISLDDDDQDVFLLFARDYLRDGDFEDDPRAGQGSGATSDYLENLSPWSRDQWDSSGALDRDWSQTEGAGGGIEVTQTQLFGEDSLLFDASAPGGGTAVAALGTNMEIDTNLTGWTENVNAGTGTIAFSATAPHTAGKVILTGGDQHVDFTQAITTVALTEYFVTWWWQEGASDDLCDLRIQESSGGTEWLLTEGDASTWQAGENDIVTSDTDLSAAYVHNIIRFTTQAAIIEVTIHFAADVTGDVCNVDDVSMALVPATQIQSGTIFQVTNTTADSYAIVVNHSDGGTDSVLQVQLQDAELCTGDSTCLYWDGVSDWSTTAAWITFANVGTTSTQVAETFLAHDAALTSDHRVVVVFRALMGTAEDITLDNVFLVETATVDTDIALYGSHAKDGAVITVELPKGVKGRFVTDATGTIGVHFLGQFYGGL